METPSSIRRVTRSQAKASMNIIPMSRKNEESEKVYSRKRNVKIDRSALIDITNDSPIVGLASGSLETPSSLVKKREQPKQTPGSGEALLRGQVKILLQKVEEEAELSKLSFENRSFIGLKGIANSPSGVLAPTPANTPQVLNGDIIINFDGFPSETITEVKEETVIHQVAMVIEDSKEETLESEKSDITRSLLFDFIEKSEISDSSPCSSVLTFGEESVGKEKSSTEEDDASVWSIQVNTSVQDDDEEEGIEEDFNEEEEEEEEDYQEGGEEGGLVDELCEGLSKISVQSKNSIPEFAGKHTRFVYNNEGEIEGEEVVSDPSAASPSIVRLKGLPKPEGMHLRFPEEDEV